jgi:hypothetical protein
MLSSSVLSGNLYLLLLHCKCFIFTSFFFPLHVPWSIECFNACFWDIWLSMLQRSLIVLFVGNVKLEFLVLFVYYISLQPIPFYLICTCHPILCGLGVLQILMVANTENCWSETVSRSLVMKSSILKVIQMLFR